ncbi:hypothetical protein [Listeria booriae]|uniref:Uncharacterized protein n=1 Tax=Listeria booriae TaxID=1552123 RepID=A0A841ZTL5_9LIST|nr:hypothetical protein [Listeria booriae]MBC1565071.1 hypothetical protein [Listeria booriae]
MQKLPMQYLNLDQYYLDLKSFLAPPWQVDNFNTTEAIKEELAYLAYDTSYEEHQYIEKLESKDAKDGLNRQFVFQMRNNPIEEGICIFEYVGHRT